MTTVAERLSQLSGLPVGTATLSQHMRAISGLSGVSLAAMLIAYSGLPAGSATMAEHLLVDHAVAGSREFVRLASPIKTSVSMTSKVV